MADPKLRVAHIITQLELGGAQRNTLYTVESLDLTRFEPCLISGIGGMLDNEAQLLKIPHFFVRPLVRPIRPIKDVRAILEIYRLLRHFRPDIVHTHSSKAGILGRIAAYFAGVPVIIHTYHGFGFTPRQRPWLRNFLIGVEKACAWMSTHLVFVSEDNRREAAQLRIGPRTSTSLIRSGIEITPKPWTGEERRKAPPEDIFSEWQLPTDAWIVCYVGNFKPQKNPFDLIKVAADVVRASPEAHFLLVGDGEGKEKMQRAIAEQSLENKVKLVGWRRRDEVRRILAQSKVFLLTSLWEGLPRALVEAFAAQRPGVAYAVNGVRDILKDGENGFLIPPGDTALAAEKILWLKDHPQEAAAMGQRARALVETEFDIDRMVRQQEELYDKLFKEVPLKSHYTLHGTTANHDPA
jgi:glycosyltransferase involved in cell wall biosynthesis